MGGSCPKKPWDSQGFQESIFKSQVKEDSHRVCDQSLYNSPIGWWWGNRAVSQELTLSFLRIQEAWAYELMVIREVHICKAIQEVCIRYYLGTSERRRSRGYRGRACPRKPLKVQLGCTIIFIEAQIFPYWASRSLLTMGPESFDVTMKSLRTSFLHAMTRFSSCHRNLFSISCSRPRISHSLRSPGFLWL